MSELDSFHQAARDERNWFGWRQILDSQGRRVANVWTLELNDWMAHQFQELVFPHHKIDFLAGSVVKLPDGRTRYEFELDDETTEHFYLVLNAVYRKQQVN